MSEPVWTSFPASLTRFLLMGSSYFAYTARLRRSVIDTDCPFSNSLFLYVLLLLSLRIVIQSKAHQFETDNYPRDSICTSVDIRNSLEMFSALENCEVIEGALQIILLDNVNETELSRLSFPLLTEITDYLLLYRVHGLRSIGQLFPNLTVIRGRTKFLGEYSLGIFEMLSLQEIGLYSLTEISTGAVHIDRNPSLCFVHTIDWDRIMRQKSDRTFIKSLKPANACPVCPGDDGRVENRNTSLSCPRAPRTSSDSFEKDKFLCWNRAHCQKICPSECKHSCNDKGQCCHESCLSCSNEDRSLCTVCRNITMGHGRDKKCISKCPQNYYKYFNRRCITLDQCVKMEKPVSMVPSDEDLPRSYKVYNNETCVLSCPSNYMSSPDDHFCKPCEGRCQKECDGVNIDSLNAAKLLRGCTHINGAIEIQIRGGANVVSEFEESLSMIEEISGYLKIVRSFPLISLNFFKSLKRIRGEYLESNKYVFVVLDNQNLQELWDWTNRTLRIDNGKLFFHFNPKLCLDKIRMLQIKAGLKNFTDLEVASNSNGDKIACNVSDLTVKVVQIRNKSVVLQWNQFHMDDQRKLLAYSVYCIEAPNQNITMFDGRDACGFDNWRVYDVQYPEGEDTVVHILPGLKPYTQYAYYVKTYTVASEPNGAQSSIQYFTTLPSRPSQPTNVYITSESSNSLRVSWSPPSSPNGNITHYFVTGEKNVNGYMYSKDRNYCADPPTMLPRDDNQIVQFATTTPSPTNDSCQCEKYDGKRIQVTAEEQEARIKFEDELQNEIYQKRGSSVRKKRDLTDFEDDYSVGVKNVTENSTNTWTTFNYTVYGKTEIYIEKLHHYSLYHIYVEACRAVEGKEDTDPSCSTKLKQLARTQKKFGADNITRVAVTNKSLDAITISWDQPEDPNGVIFTYTVEYQRVDTKYSKVNIHPVSMCIPGNLGKNKTVVHTITKLAAGNYSLRVSATTAVSTGIFSPYVYFYIEESSSNTVLIVCLILTFFVAVFAFLGWLYRKHIKEKNNIKLIQSVNPEYVPSVYVPDEWEVPRNNIEFTRELGQGSFGMVWEGIARNINGQAEVRCAVKTVNEHATPRERLEFLNEASVMKAFNTTHVVRLLGVVSQGQPTLVIMELMANGDLRSYLRSHRPDVENFDPSNARQPPTLKQVLHMAIEIADGMAYLAAKKFVHRDLAARNCMISDNLTVKIGDFGMTRDIYETEYYRKGTKGLLPVRWMAPESLKDGVFTSSSDVWSYGVVLWEMATLASQPYPGLSNDQVLRYVIDGGVMERPENCPDKLYTLMSYCWQHKPSLRPTFLKLCSMLLEDASLHFSRVSFYNSPAGIEARSSKSNPSPSHTDNVTTPLRRVGEKLRGLMTSEERDVDEINIDTYHQFPNISDSDVVTSATANGYVSGCQTEETQP